MKSARRVAIHQITRMVMSGRIGVYVTLVALVFLGCDEDVEKKESIEIVHGPSAVLLAPTTVQITWETDLPANSIVEYGLTLQLDSIYVDDEESESHSVILSNLFQDTTYYFRVRSVSSAYDSEATSEIDTFVTGMIEMRIVAGPSVEVLSATEIRITWETDILGNSMVRYGLNAQLDFSYTDGREVKSHKVTISGLMPDTVYYYQVTSVLNSMGLQVSSDVSTFRTGEDVITIIAGPLVQHVSPVEVLITWNTNHSGNSVVEYGTSADLDSQIVDPVEVLFHSVTIDRLRPNTMYYYRVASNSQSLNVQVTSEVDSFTTQEGMITIVSGPSVDILSPTEVVIVWDTDFEGNSVVDYDTTVELSSQFVDSLETVTHGVNLTGLTPTTRYYYRVTSVSSYLGATVSSEIDSFITDEGSIHFISLPSVEAISPTEIVVSWETDVPGNSIVDYGLSAVLDSQVVDIEERLFHSVYVGNLLPGTLYFYRVTSESALMGAQVFSDVDTFHTMEGEITIIAGPSVEQASPSEVFIVWETDVPGNSIVDYGLVLEIGLHVEDDEEVIVHGILLRELLPDTTYYYQVTSVSSLFNAQVSSEIDTFSVSGSGR